MSYQSNKENYLRLSREYISGARNAEALCTELMALWRCDRDEELAQAASWPQRYDLELLAANQEGRLSDEAFSAAWTDLWGYAGQEHLHAMVDRLFSACDAFEDNANGPPAISDDELREEVIKSVGEYELDERRQRRR